MKDGEPLLDRREFLIGAASLFTASISLILQAQEALARNSHKDIERLLSSGKYDEAIKKCKKEIEDIYEIYVDFPEGNIELRESKDEASHFAKLTEKTIQIGALLDLRRYLLKFPPKSVPKLTKLSPTYLKQIVIASKVEGSSRREGRYEVGGFAYASQMRLALSISKMQGPNGETRYSLSKPKLTHEIAHLILRDITESEWVHLINKKIYQEFDNSFPPKYIFDPAYVHRKMSEYDVPRPRPHGSARFYGTDNFGDDMATASEALYHGNVSQQEIDEEKPPLLKVKIEVLKDIIAKKIGLPDKGPMSGKSYWSLVNTSMFTDGLLDNVTHKSTIQKNIQDEFDMWENWWELFKK